MRTLSLWVSMLVVGAFLATGCGKKEEAGNEGAPATETTAIDPATAATVTGKIAFEGTAPAKGEPIKTDADPKCKEMHANAPLYQTPVIVNSNNTLKNVIVYVKSGLEGKKFPVPTDPMEINQQGCEYHPHVFGIRAGQKLLIKNSDPTLHNIHARPVVNAEFNVGQPNQGMTTTKEFTKAEVPVPFRCDVHSWMNAYAGVFDNPFFAVTGDDGSFTLKGLPPGTYTIAAWQEKYGTQETSVTLAAKETKDVTLTFKGQ